MTKYTKKAGRLWYEGALKLKAQIDKKKADRSMYIINSGIFYPETNGTVYLGKIRVTKGNFDRVVKSFLESKKVDNFTKHLLQDDIKKQKDNLYALRVTFTDYLISKSTNTSRYKYKRQNYIIQIIK